MRKDFTQKPSAIQRGLRVSHITPQRSQRSFAFPQAEFVYLLRLAW